MNYKAGKKGATLIQLSHGWAFFNQHSYGVSNFFLLDVYLITNAVNNGYNKKGYIYWICTLIQALNY